MGQFKVLFEKLNCVIVSFTRTLVVHITNAVHYFKNTDLRNKPCPYKTNLFSSKYENTTFAALVLV